MVSSYVYLIIVSLSCKLTNPVNQQFPVMVATIFRRSMKKTEPRHQGGVGNAVLRRKRNKRNKDIPVNEQI